MKKKVFCFLMALIMGLTPFLFAGCESFDDSGSGSGGSGGSGGGGEGGGSVGPGESFFAEFFDGFKVVYSESQIGQEKGTLELTNQLYDYAIISKLSSKFGSGHLDTEFFPDAIRQTIINENGTAKLVEDAPVWNWTLNPNDEKASVETVKSLFVGDDADYKVYEDFKNQFVEDYGADYPQLSDYYSIPIQIVLFETMLGYEQTTFEVEIVEEKLRPDIPVQVGSKNYDAYENSFRIKVKSSPRNDLVGEIVYEWINVYFYANVGTKNDLDDYSSKIDINDENYEGDSKLLDYLGSWNTESKIGVGLMAEYYSKATYCGLTKSDADELITYILDEVIGHEVVEYDHENFANTDNYRNYVKTVAEMIYSAVYDGSKDFIYTYQIGGDLITYDFKTEFLDNYTPEEIEAMIADKKIQEFRPRSSSFLRDYETDMFFESGNAFEGLEGATSFENSPMSEYQSVAIMSAQEDLELSGIIMQIFSPNPDLAITVYVRFWAYDSETGEGQLFEWEQDEINFYQSMPYDNAYVGEDCAGHKYVDGKGYLYKTTEDGIDGYYTDFEVGVDLTDVPEKFQAPYDRNDPTEIQIDGIKLPKFENSSEDPKLKAEGDTTNGITEVNLFEESDYAYKVVPSKNGFGGVTVLDESKINFSFYEMVFDIQKDPTLESTNYDYKLAVVMPL